VIGVGVRVRVKRTLCVFFFDFIFSALDCITAGTAACLAALWVKGVGFLVPAEKVYVCGRGGGE
jgi:hypothetical protein